MQLQPVVIPVTFETQFYIVAELRLVGIQRRLRWIRRKSRESSGAISFAVGDIDIMICVAIGEPDLRAESAESGCSAGIRSCFKLRIRIRIFLVFPQYRHF